MPRTIRDWKPERADDTPNAPHRYRWDDDRPAPKTLGDARKMAPYKPGEVVLVERVLDDLSRCFERVRIVNILTRFNRYGEPVEWYTAQRETVKGLWSKQWIRIHPGEIQRGYQRAGLAPEMPEDA